MTLRLMMKCVALCAVLTAGGAHALAFAFAGYNDSINACDGRLLGMVAKAADACRSDPNGLGAGGFMMLGSDTCESCMTYDFDDVCTGVEPTGMSTRMRWIVGLMLSGSLPPDLLEEYWEYFYGC